MSFQSLQTSTEHSLLQVRCSFSSRWVATNMFALVTPTSKGRLKKSPNERYYKLKQYLSYGPQSSFKPTRIFGGFGSCRSNDDFYIKKKLMLVLGPHDKTGRQIWIKQIEVIPLTVSRTSSNCVQNSDGPTIQHILLWVYNIGGSQRYGALLQIKVRHC